LRILSENGIEDRKPDGWYKQHNWLNAVEEIYKVIGGIGHYSYKKISDDVAEIICDNLYPCDFDRGIIEAMARKFKPIHTIVITELVETNGCRKRGGESCLYRIFWKSGREE
jgi:hypothetical protein